MTLKDTTKAEEQHKIIQDFINTPKFQKTRIIEYRRVIKAVIKKVLREYPSATLENILEKWGRDEPKYNYIIKEEYYKITDNNLLKTYYSLPKTYQKAIVRMVNTMHSQYEKGIKKYGVNMDEVKQDDYNWNDMAMEEMADMLVYIEKGRNE